MMQKVVTMVSGALLLFGALTTTTTPMSIWHPTPTPTVTQTVAPKPALAPEVTLASYTRVMQKVTYTITVVRKNTASTVDGYAVRIVSPTKTVLNLSLTKTEATRVIALVQQYKPSTVQLLTARLLVLALL